MCQGPFSLDRGPWHKRHCQYCKYATPTKTGFCGGLCVGGPTLL